MYVAQKGKSNLTSYFTAVGSCQAREARGKGRKRLSQELLGVRIYCYCERKWSSRGVGLEQGPEAGVNCCLVTLDILWKFFRTLKIEYVLGLHGREVDELM